MRRSFDTANGRSRRLLRRAMNGWEDNIKMDLKNRIGGYVLD
jgi:hypothetical protein